MISPEVECYVKAPDECTSSELDEFKVLVIKGGEVNPRTLDGLVARSYALAFLRSDGNLAAVGGLKRPNPERRKNVFAKAMVSDPDIYPYELGWVVVDPAFRRLGYSKSVLQSLMKRLEDAQAYATSHTTNNPMHAALKASGFTPVGNSYPSDMPERKLQLFTKMNTNQK